MIIKFEAVGITAAAVRAAQRGESLAIAKALFGGDALEILELLAEWRWGQAAKFGNPRGRRGAPLTFLTYCALSLRKLKELNVPSFSPFFSPF